MIKIKDIRNRDKWTELGIVSLKSLYNILGQFVYNCEMNNIDPDDVPVLINENCNSSYKLSYSSLSFGKDKTVLLQFSKNDEIDYYEGEDKQPEDGGEYWYSRGVGYDLAGFVVSKEAGERLLTLVKDVLNNDKPKSWLDWRKFEPNWIQFKFQEEEFDLEKLDKLAKGNNNILTYDILSECKR